MKYDETTQQTSKKEEVLRKVFFKESAKMEDQRQPALNQAGQFIVQQRGMKHNDQATTLQILQHALQESMYIKDINAVIAAGGK